jgi:fatty-acyl-CoA synthase
VGELQIAGTSVMSGYYHRPDANAETLVDGWLRTGDMAYLVDGQMVMCGRIKDLIIVGGRNVYPQDVERAVGRVDGVRAGNVIAFGVPGRAGKERLVVVAETRTDDVDRLRSQIGEQTVAAIGVPCHDVVLVQPGSLPKTSSGKLQRNLCRQHYQAAALQPAAGAEGAQAAFNSDMTLLQRSGSDL